VAPTPVSLVGICSLLGVWSPHPGAYRALVWLPHQPGPHPGAYRALVWLPHGQAAAHRPDNLPSYTIETLGWTCAHKLDLAVRVHTTPNALFSHHEAPGSIPPGADQLYRYFQQVMGPADAGTCTEASLTSVTSSRSDKLSAKRSLTLRETINSPGCTTRDSNPRSQDLRTISLTLRPAVDIRETVST